MGVDLIQNEDMKKNSGSVRNSAIGKKCLLKLSIPSVTFS